MSKATLPANNTENNSKNNSVFNLLNQNNDEIKPTPAPAPEKTPEKLIYYIYLGNNDSEYYSFDVPVIDNSGHLICNKALKKSVLQEKVLNQILSVEYNDSEKNTEEALNIDIVSSGGVVIKCFKKGGVQTNWISKNLKNAIEEMKQLKLNMYEKTLPDLITRLNKAEQVINKQQQRNQQREEEDINDDDDGLMNL